MKKLTKAEKVLLKEALQNYVEDFSSLYFDGNIKTPEFDYIIDAIQKIRSKLNLT